MPDRRIYQPPPRMSRSELEAEFATNDGERVRNALIAATYTEPPEWVEQWCFRFAPHPDSAAREGAAIVLGNLAWLHGLRDVSRAVTVLQELKQDTDPAVKVSADDSLTWVLDSAERRKQTQ